MSLLAKIENDLVIAQKEKNGLKVSTLRFLLSKIYNSQIQKGKDKPLSDAEIAAEILKEAKNHKESIEAYTDAARYDLAEKERAELGILEKYLPKMLSEWQISKIVVGAISEINTPTQADFGKVMQGVMAKVAGRAEGAVVAEIVKNKLSR